MCEEKRVWRQSLLRILWKKEHISKGTVELLKHAVLLCTMGVILNDATLLLVWLECEFGMSRLIWGLDGEGVSVRLLYRM